MGPIDRLRSRVQPQDGDRGRSTPGPAESRQEEEALRARLRQDPNDVQAFARLAEVVRLRAAEGHEALAAERQPYPDPQAEADDAVWALAEELAHSGRAWYPLIELARLSIDDDREVALRRLGTAAERDPTGTALAHGLRMLRKAGHPSDALALGVGHWRPREHVLEAGRHVVKAAVEAGRLAEARRHLEALSLHPDRAGVDALRRELERLMAAAERSGRPKPAVVDVRATHHGRQTAQPRPAVDVRPSVLARLRALLRR